MRRVFLLNGGFSFGRKKSNQKKADLALIFNVRYGEPMVYQSTVGERIALPQERIQIDRPEQLMQIRQSPGVKIGSGLRPVYFEN